MNILSLFDGMACGLVALKCAGLNIDNYFASETDKYAIRIAMKNHPEIIQLGDINNYQEWDLPNIDMIIGGSPCQGFSVAGNQLNFNDPRSALFFRFVDCLDKFNPTWFLLENVKMKQEWRDKISEILGVTPIEINSALVSAQNRRRLYWCNWDVSQPDDRGIFLDDILETPGIPVIRNHGVWKQIGNKTNCIVASYHKGADNHGQRTMIKSQTILSTIYKENVKSMLKRRKLGLIVSMNDQIRKLSPLECERLQTLPDNYTAGVSNTQRYRMIGNGWTVDVIAHIFTEIKKKRIDMPHIDHEYTDNVVCPWCGYEDIDSWEYIEDTENDIECPECGKLFDMERHTQVTYTTKRARCEPGKCQYVLRPPRSRNPFIFEGNNYTVWMCKICYHEKVKKSPVSGEPFVEKLTEEDRKI